MWAAKAIAETIADKIDSAGLFDSAVAVDLVSRWEESAEKFLPPTVQLISIDRERVDRQCIRVNYAYLFRRATTEQPESRELIDGVDSLLDSPSNRVFNVSGVGICYYNGFIFNAPTRINTGGETISGAFDSLLLERDGAFFQTAIIKFFRFEDREGAPLGDGNE